MGVRETLDKIENMVATAKTFPFTGHILINDNDLVHYVEELRNDLPKELEKADAIMKQREGILKDAQREAEHIRKEAQDQAALMVEHSEIVMQSKQRGKEILQQTQQQSKEMIDAAKAQAQELQDNVDLYANQVFEQLIAHVVEQTIARLLELLVAAHVLDAMELVEQVAMNAGIGQQCLGMLGLRILLRIRANVVMDKLACCIGELGVRRQIGALQVGGDVDARIH